MTSSLDTFKFECLHQKIFSACHWCKDTLCKPVYSSASLTHLLLLSVKLKARSGSCLWVFIPKITILKLVLGMFYCVHVLQMALGNKMSGLDSSHSCVERFEMNSNKTGSIDVGTIAKLNSNGICYWETSVPSFYAHLLNPETGRSSPRESPYLFQNLLRKQSPWTAMFKAMGQINVSSFFQLKSQGPTVSRHGSAISHAELRSPGTQYRKSINRPNSPSANAVKCGFIIEVTVFTVSVEARLSCLMALLHVPGWCSILFCCWNWELLSDLE